MTPPCLLLDLDGTLIDSAPDLLAAVNRLLKRRGLDPLGRTEIIPMIGDGTRMLLTRALAARNAPPFTEDEYENYMADYTAHSVDETRPFPGTIKTLAQLAEAGWLLAVCTNKPVGATHAILRTLGLDGFFAAVGGGDSFPVRKPDPGHLLGTLALAGGTVDRAVMVGDHNNDVQAAVGAHVPCIFACWGYGPGSMAEGAKATAARFVDLPEIAEGLLNGR
jgi:phosphoglycolate phosphatase